MINPQKTYGAGAKYSDSMPFLTALALFGMG
jgi:hypothetical protein